MLDSSPTCHTFVWFFSTSATDPDKFVNVNLAAIVSALLPTVMASRIAGASLQAPACKRQLAPTPCMAQSQQRLTGSWAWRRGGGCDLGWIPGDARDAQVSNLLHHPLHHDAALLHVWHMRLHCSAEVLQLAGGGHLGAGLHNALHLLPPPRHLLLLLLSLHHMAHVIPALRFCHASCMILSGSASAESAPHGSCHTSPVTLSCRRVRIVCKER